MASKDWKLERRWKHDGKEGRTINNKKEKDYFIQVFYAENHDPSWRFTVHRGGRIIEEELFDLNKEALSSARKYMRTH